MNLPLAVEIKTEYQTVVSVLSSPLAADVASRPLLPDPCTAARQAYEDSAQWLTHVKRSMAPPSSPTSRLEDASSAEGRDDVGATSGETGNDDGAGGKLDGSGEKADGTGATTDAVAV